MDMNRMDVRLPAGEASVEGRLCVPVGARSSVVIPRRQSEGGAPDREERIAGVLQRSGFATLLLDPLRSGAGGGTEKPFRPAAGAGARLLSRVAADLRRAEVPALPIGGLADGGEVAAILMAAGMEPGAFDALVCVGGRPDFATGWLPRIHAPTLLILGGHDEGLRILAQDVLQQLPPSSSTALIPGAGHRLDEAGALEEAAWLASRWFSRHLLHPAHLWPGPRLAERRFQDRAQAGRMLAAELFPYAGVANATVLGISAGGVVVGAEVARRLGVPLQVHRSNADLHERTVILVDEGAVTGGTVRAAIAAVRSQRPGRVVVALPMAPPETCQALAGEADELVCLIAPELFFHVGWWYRDFPECDEETVRTVVAGAPELLRI